jgi:Flp pilus assembly CpaF family ATPase
VEVCRYPRRTGIAGAGRDGGGVAMTALSRDEIVLERQRANIVALLGDAINGWLAESDVTDITLNPPLQGEAHGRLWVERLGCDRESVGFMVPDQALRLIGAVAASMGKELTIDTPSVEGILVTDGSRFTGFASPLTAAPCFSIRRRASAVFPFSQYVADGKMTERQRAILEDAVARRLNTIIVGSTGAGKSTLLNAFIRSMTEITPYHRFVILEDTAELQCAAPVIAG